MSTRYLHHNEYAKKIIVVCQDIDLILHINSYFKFADMSAVEMSADMLIESIPGFRDTTISMIILEGKKNIQRILNKNYLLRRDHPNLKFIIMLDEPAEAFKTEEHFEYVKYLHKEEVIQKISTLLGYIHSSVKYPAPSIRHNYDNIHNIDHTIDMYV